MSTDGWTIPQVLHRIADRFSNHEALVTPDRTVTYGTLRDEVRTAAAAIIALGITTGERVAIWSPNTWHWVVACLATHYAGGVVVPLNTRYTASEATDILVRSGAPLLFASAPFFHNFGYKAGILACLQTGATLIPALTFDPEQTMQAVQDHRITVLPGPPTIFSTLLDHPRRGDYDLTSLRFAVTGAAVVPVVLIERMQSELDIDIVLTAYELTEACGFGTMCRADDDAVTVATTCGRPIAEFELRIDGAGAAGETGEVLLRGPNVMLGYLDDEQATAAAIDADGWLHTGDVGAVDDNGNLRITDRLKDMYICGGFNVYPAEIEQVLARLDGVAESAVIGVPDERLGEVGKAFVVVKPGVTLDEETVIAYAKQHLANFKTPRSVEFLEVLPRNPGGKVVKPLLRERA